MTHYICTGGCNGVTEKEGAVCQATDCAKYQKPLVSCDCEDSQHGGMMKDGEE